MEKQAKLAIATVTSQDFVPGTLVLIHSFLKHNPWFKGDIVIICDSLEVEKKRLFQVFPRVIFKRPSDDLLLKIGHLCRNLPKLFPKRQRFYSIEVFNLESYDKLLFFDSDMLICGNLSEIVTLPQELLACSDNPYEKTGSVRNKISYKWLPNDQKANNPEILPMTFNSGFMVVGKEFLNPETYKDLKRLIDTSIFDKIRTHNTDQVVLNLHFDGKVTFLPAGYNLILSQSPELIKNDRIDTDEIKILHFTGKYKPWEATEKMDELMKDPYYSKFIADWHAEYESVKSKVGK